ADQSQRREGLRGGGHAAAAAGTTARRAVARRHAADAGWKEAVLQLTRVDGGLRFARNLRRAGLRAGGPMRYKYGKYIPDLLDDLDMDELMSRLSDLLLSSGFNDPYFSGSDDDRSMQALYDAILEALLSGGVLPDEALNQLL